MVSHMPPPREVNSGVTAQCASAQDYKSSASDVRPEREQLPNAKGRKTMQTGIKLPLLCCCISSWHTQRFLADL